MLNIMLTVISTAIATLGTVPKACEKIERNVHCECRSLRFNRYNFLDWTLPPAPVASGWKVQEELPAWTPAGANSIFLKLPACETDVFLCGSLARQKKKKGKHVDCLVWFDLNYHFRGVFPLLEHLWVHLFRFTFHVEECMLALRWTCAQIQIYIFISSRLMFFDFWPHFLLSSWSWEKLTPSRSQNR